MISEKVGMTAENATVEMLVEARPGEGYQERNHHCRAGRQPGNKNPELSDWIRIRRDHLPIMIAKNSKERRQKLARRV